MSFYDWDSKKERNDVRKRSIMFDEAESVVDSPSSRTRYDALHSEDEPRFITTAGPSWVDCSWW